jgi:excisionase family DNA binding protein
MTTLAPDPVPHLMTIDEVADALRVTRSTVRRWIKSGHLAAARVGPGTVRVEAAEVRRLVERS